MFSCCVPAPRGSGLKKDNREGNRGIWRHRVLSCLLCLWPFSRNRNILTKENQDLDLTDQGENTSPLQEVGELHGESQNSAETVVKLGNNLVPSLQEGDPFFFPGCLSTCQRFVTPLQALDLLHVKYANFGPYSEEDEQVKNTLCSFLDTWMDKNPEEFCEPTDVLTLKYLKASYIVFMAHSDLSVRVNRIQTMLQKIKAKDLQSEDEEDSDLGIYKSSDPEIQWV
ncbi:ral guanine nucleotide dissociation stimulator-like [Apodemus sylvaticus]|uniref:ral guanine nucleotide dissociation stimulator-like n=1 Tax=Apodemus sylvaticus TaxID=10129 RepID=UPI002244481C|nr:ral guanine nucleotide dissociation stimulator-like [Apodemus sylvaticus]